MQSSMVKAIVEDFGNGGTIDGDLVITGDLQVNGDGTLSFDEVLQGSLGVTGTITVGVDDAGHDVKFFGNTASAYMLWDTSEDDLVLAGAAGLDIAGDIDVDGTANLDIVDIDGAVDMASTLQLDGTLTVSADDTGADVRFYSATASEGMLYDASEDELGLLLTTKLKFHDIGGGEEIYASADGHLEINAGTTLDITAPTVDINASSELNIDGNVDLNGTLDVSGTLTVGADGSGTDVIFYSATAGDNFTWDASEEKLTITGTNAQTALDIADGNVTIADDLAVDGTTNLDNTDIDGTLVVDGSNISLDSTSTLNIDNSNTSNGITIGTATSAVPISIGHTTSVITLNDEVDITGTLDINDTTDSSSKTTGALKVDGGVGIALKLFVGTDLDVDGTTNLDVVDIDGAVQLDATLTIGADDQGYDVIFYGNTASSNMTWDTSEDDLVLNDATLKIDQDDNAHGINIDCEASGNYGIYVTGKYASRFAQDVSGGSAMDITRDIAESGSNPLVSIVDDNANNTQPSLKIQQDGAGIGLSIDQNGNKEAINIDSTSTSEHVLSATASSLTTGRLGYFYSNSSSTGTRDLIQIVNDNTAATGTTCLLIDQDANYRALTIQSAVTTENTIICDTPATTTGNVLNLNNADSLTTGAIANFHSNSSTTDTRNLVKITNDNASATGTTGLYIQQDSTGPAISSTGDIVIDSDTKGLVLGADQDATIYSDAVGDIYFVSGTDVTPAGGDTEGWFKMDIGTSAETWFGIYGGEGGLATLYLAADNSDDNADSWRVAADTSGNLIFDNLSTGAWVSKMKLDANSRISLSNNDSGTSNTVFGKLAGNLIGSGDNYNVFIGENVADADMTNATYNTGVGYNAMSALTEGDNNTGAGHKALYNLSTGSGNTAVGDNALNSTATVDANTGIGYYSGLYTTGANNTYVGYNAGKGANGAEANNTAVGKDALLAITDGEMNVAIGATAGDSLTTGDSNVFVGRDAASETADIDKSVVIGAAAIADGVATSAADGTIAIGYESLKSLTSGAGNTAVGYNSLLTTATGTQNTAVGYEALKLAIDGGDQCTAVGYKALDAANNQYSDKNTAVGSDALGANTSGQQNTSLGANTGGTLTTGDGCVLLGENSDVSTADAQNQIVIGQGVTGQANNSVTLGGAAITAVYMASDSQALVHSAGIQFAGTQVSNAGANVLDDYEEGTFTMGQGGITVSSIANTTGYYTKIGNMVYFSWYSGAMTLASISGEATLTGLPFATGNATAQYSHFTVLHNTAVDGSTKGGYIAPGGTTGYFLDLNSSGVAQWIAGSTLYIMVQGFYQT